MNPLRQTNQGCRACLAGEYHEDFGLPRCVPCGSSCPPGYASEGAPWQTCGPSVSTARLIGTAEIPANLAIGCQPCALPTALVGITQYVSLFDGMHYVDGCDFSCAAPGLQQFTQKLHNTTRLSALSVRLSPFQHSSSARRASDVHDSSPWLPQSTPFA